MHRCQLSLRHKEPEPETCDWNSRGTLAPRNKAAASAATKCVPMPIGMATSTPTDHWHHSTHRDVDTNCKHLLWLWRHNPAHTLNLTAPPRVTFGCQQSPSSTRRELLHTETEESNIFGTPPPAVRFL